MSSETLVLTVFLIDGQRYALSIDRVVRIVHAVAVTPLPKAPEIILGVITVEGQIIPLVNLRRRFRLPERDIDLSDQFIIANTARRTVALVADEVTAVVEIPGANVTAAGAVVPGIAYVAGVAVQEDQLILIHDLDTFLSLDEENALHEALRD